MTGEQYWRALQEHWRVVVAAVLVGLLIATGVLLVVPRKYAAGVDAFVLPAGAAADASAAYQGGLLSEQRVKSYVQLFEGGRVSELVVQRLNLPISPDELTRKITVSAQADTVILSISVVDTSPEQALLIAGTAAGAFQALVAQLEQPPDPRLPSATSVKIVAPPRLADGPVSPSKLLHLLLGATLGLLVGVVLALRRDARGRPVRSVDQLHELLGVPTLGVVLERERSRAALAALDHGSPDAEAMRQVRTGLQFADVDHTQKVVVITSALEGEGKTGTACSLAGVLAAAGHAVLLVDADLRQHGASTLLEVEDAVGLSTVLMGRVPLEEAVQTHRAGFDVLASGPLPPNPSELAASESMAQTFRRMRERYEYVLVDTAPLLPVTDTASLAGLADGTVLVCRYGSTRDTDLRAARATLDVVRASVWGTILSVVPRRAAGARSYGSYGQGGAGPLSGPMPLPRRPAAEGSEGEASPRSATHRSGPRPQEDAERTATIPLRSRGGPPRAPAGRPGGRHR